MPLFTSNRYFSHEFLEKNFCFGLLDGAKDLYVIDLNNLLVLLTAILLCTISVCYTYYIYISVSKNTRITLMINKTVNMTLNVTF